MDHHLTIGSEAAIALATRLAAVTGAAMDDVFTGARRNSLPAERRRQDRVAPTMEATDRFADLLDNPPPGSDHRWMDHGETGLPI